jgi:hypothetical protein
MLLAETLFRLADQTVERALFAGPFAVAKSCGSARICASRLRRMAPNLSSQRLYGWS